MLLWFLDAVADRVNDYKLALGLLNRPDSISGYGGGAREKTKAIHPLSNCCLVSEEYKNRDEQAYD